MMDDLRWLGGRLLFVTACLGGCWILSGCSSTPGISVVTPDVTITPPAALMQPPEALTPAFWTDAKTVPIEDAHTAAPKAATAPKAPAAIAVAPTAVPVAAVPAPATPTPIPAPAAPKPLIPPAPAAQTQGKETGLAPMPTAPQ